MRVPNHGSVSPVQAGVHANQLLQRLDAGALARLQPYLKSLIFEAREVLYHPSENIRHIYFPDTAVLCMLTVMADGRSIESATVGREGASWISASVGAPTMPCQTMVAIGGAGYSVDIRYVEDEIRQNGSFHQALTRYSHALLIHALRTGSCNGLHSLQERCARWMLTTLDRTLAEDFAVTHEFLASLLGCSRPVLTEILGELERNGSITLHRGSIHVVNRTALEACCCECYWVIRKNHEHLQVDPKNGAERPALG
jgi:CRP-like cAMP-binding protein